MTIRISLPSPVSSLFPFLHHHLPMLSARSLEPLSLSDRLPFPTLSPRPPPLPLDVIMDGTSPSHDDAPPPPPQPSSTSGQVFSFLSTFVSLVNHNHLIISFPGSLKTFFQDTLSLKARKYSLSTRLPYIRAPNHDFQAWLHFSPLHPFPVQLSRRVKRSRFHPIFRTFRSPATSTTPCGQSSQTFLRPT